MPEDKNGLLTASVWSPPVTRLLFVDPGLSVLSDEPGERRRALTHTGGVGIIFRAVSPARRRSAAALRFIGFAAAAGVLDDADTVRFGYGAGGSGMAFANLFAQAGGLIALILRVKEKQPAGDAAGMADAGSGGGQWSVDYFQFAQ